MKPELVILTKHYPFGTGEPFVGNEVSILKRYYNIHIIADSYTNGESCLNGDEEITVSRVPLLDWPTKSDRINALKLLLKSFLLVKEAIQVVIRYNIHSSKFLRDMLNQIAFGEQYYNYLIRNRFVSPNKPTIIYSFWNVYKVVPFLLRKGTNRKWRVVSRIHGVDFYNERYSNGRQPLKSINRRLDRLYFLSQYAVEYYEKQFGKLPNRCKRIAPLGVENTIKMVSHEKRNSFNIVSCSRVVKVKRLERIVRALELIDSISISWTHLGDGELMGELKEEVSNRLSNKNNITVNLFGAVDNSQVKEFYHKSNPDCFVITSESEGTPVSIMEALSFGIPIVSYDAGSIPEMLEGSKNIILPQEATPTDLSNAIQVISSMSSSEKNELRSANRKLWHEKYNAEKNIQLMSQDMLSLLEH